MASVLMVADSLGIGGAERHVVALSRLLAERGHDVRLAISAGGPLLDEATQAGLEVHELGRPFKRCINPAFAAFVAGELRRQPTDLVHAHMFASAAAAAGALDGQGCPLVVTEHSEAVWRTPADVDLSRAIYRRSNAVIAVSNPIAIRLVHEDRVPARRVVTIPNSVFVRAVKRPSVADGPPTVGVIARLRPEKGVDVFLRAATVVAAARPDARFVVIGEGPEASSLQRLATANGWDPNRLVFLGPRSDAQRLLAQFAVLAVPSVANEGTPLVVLEAMELGVPIVASRTGGIPEQVRHRIDGLLVHPGDPHALATGIISVLKNPQAARRRSATAARRVRVHFSPRRLVTGVEDVYRRHCNIDPPATGSSIAVNEESH